MVDTEIKLDADGSYPTPPDAEASSRERGWKPAYFVTVEYARDPNNPDDAVYFRLADGKYEPRRRFNVYEGEDPDAALDAAIAAEETDAVSVRILEVSAYDRESIAAERAYEARYG